MALRDILTITTAEAQEYCQVPAGTMDWYFELLIDAAIEAAENYLCFNFSGYSVSSGDDRAALSIVKLGCLICIGRWYEYRRDGVKSESLGNESVTWDPPAEAERVWSRSKFKRLPGF